MNETIEILTWSAVALCAVGNVPQLIKVVKTGKSRDVSLWTSFIWLYVAAALTLRGIYVVKDWVFVLSQFAQFIVMAGLILSVLKMRRASEKA